jgi:hypothetical protein
MRLAVINAAAALLRGVVSSSPGFRPLHIVESITLPLITHPMANETKKAR